MKILGTLVAFTLSLLTGCANLNTINRSHSLGDQGIAIHLDASQRLAYSDKAGRMCTEPTPDALQSYASALGAGLSIPSQGSASLSNALAANSASIGLHTQSITLMRDGLYRICEGHYNGSLTQFDVAQLMQRSQDLTLAALAIEQLTGAVVARQAILTNGAQADAAADAVNTAALLDQARKDLAEKQARLKAAEEDEKNQKAAVVAADAAVKTPPSGADPKELQDTKDKADAKLKVDQQAVVDAQAAVKEQKESIVLLQTSLASARTNAKTVIESAGRFAPAGGNGQTINKDTAKVIATATENIVAGILKKDHRVDACISIVSQYAYAASENLKSEEKIEKATIDMKNVEGKSDKDSKDKANIASAGVSAAREKQRVASVVVRDLQPGYDACLMILKVTPSDTKIPPPVATQNSSTRTQ